MRGIAAIAMLLALVGTSLPTGAEVVGYAYRKMNPGSGNRTWGHQDNYGNHNCPTSGGDCIFVIIETEGDGTCETVVPCCGLLVTANLGEVGFVNTNTQQQVSTSNQSFTFISGDYKLAITYCPSHPQYEGAEVNLQGVTSDGEGKIHVYFPPIAP